MEKMNGHSILETMKNINPELRVKVTSPLLYNHALVHEEDYEKKYGRLFYEWYLSNLKKEKMDAIDYEKFREFPVDNTPQFNEWIQKREQLFKQYVSFLGYKGLTPSKYKKEHPIELFKGNFDSLKTVNKKVYEKTITVYSQYATTLNCDCENGAIQAEMSVMKGVPCYVLRTPDDKVFKVPLNMEHISRVYVHNPYTKAEARACEKLLENPDLTVIYGLYGFKDEDGIEEKIARLREISDNIKKLQPLTKFCLCEDETNLLGSTVQALVFKPRQGSEKE